MMVRIYVRVTLHTALPKDRVTMTRPKRASEILQELMTARIKEIPPSEELKKLEREQPSLDGQIKTVKVK